MQYVTHYVRFVTGRVIALQAPARTAATQAWLGSFETAMLNAVALGNKDPAAPAALLPSIFEFVFARIDEVSSFTAL